MIKEFCQHNLVKKVIILSVKEDEQMVEETFSYLKQSNLLHEQYDLAHKLDQLYQIGDYRDVLSNARMLAEVLSKKMIEFENLNRYYQVPDGQQRNLRSNINYLRENAYYPQSIFNLFDEVRRIGNDAVHDANYKATKNQAWHVICNINDILVFTLNTYEQQSLSYLRPDLMLESQDHPEWYKRRRKKLNTNSITNKNENQKLAHQFLKQKKKRHFSRLRKFLRH